MNSIDLPRAASLWTEVDRTLYNQLPIFLAKRQVEYIQEWDVWTKLLKPQKWAANMGNTMRGVNKVPAPILRGDVLPNAITQLPKKDVIEVRETKEDVQLYRHDFESNVFQFLPSFQDFLTDHVDKHIEEISDKIVTFKDLFYRTAIFHGSPYVWVCSPNDGQIELRSAPIWTSPTITRAKTTAWLQQTISKVGGTLTLENIKKLGTVMWTDLGVKPFSGNFSPDGTDGKGLKHKYCLITSSEVWDSFTDPDSFLLRNRKLDLDIVTGPFTGNLFDRFTTMFERYEMRIAADGTIPAPETVEEGANAHDLGDTVPNPAYVNAPFAVAFAVGNEAWKAVTVGPPPSKFADGGSSMTMKEFNGMDWNGKVIPTRNLLVPSLNQNNVEVLDTNKRGEYLQLIADVAMGIAPNRRRNIVPIIYQRDRISTT
jgi:hypothetical protein